MESAGQSKDKAREREGLARRRVSAWKALWMKLKKKGRIFDCCDGDPARFTYDPFAYALNFDPGLTFSDQGDISRTFSARFAAIPSRMLP
ncbi:hypothetical protein MLD38_029445 [Melastoma candidum]|uniref:Uncharacterized protein n=1 Tax=Melastoma candidum TaxID=119954 RepID=A0ACB9N5L1_9MYRT|nr:hypothetical protein MLD38_029445 [Melastoma candidum]